MARLKFPDSGNRLVYTPAGLAKAQGYTVTVYTDAAATTLADIRTEAGATISGSTLTVDAYSQLPIFQGPSTGVDTLYVVVNGGPVTPIYARADDRIDALVGGDTPLSGPLVVNPFNGDATLPVGVTGSTEDTGIRVVSSFAGGEDEGQPGQYDSTGRLNLESYQRADVGSYGEVIRIFSRRADSKQMIAWYGPKSFNPTTREPVGNSYPWFWMGAHHEANDHGSVHGHWSVEVPDKAGALQTRMEVRIWEQGAMGNASLYGLDKTLIITNLADFVVRCSNGQQLRLSAPAGTEKALMFSLDAEGADQYRRWAVRTTNEAESTGDAGSNFQIARYNDAGVFQDNPIVVSRSTGNVTLGPGFVARRASASVSSLTLNTTSLGSGLGVFAIGNANTAPSGTPTAGGVLYAEAGALKWKGSNGTVTTIAVA